MKSPHEPYDRRLGYHCAYEERVRSGVVKDDVRVDQGFRDVVQAPRAARYRRQQVDVQQDFSDDLECQSVEHAAHLLLLLWLLEF